MEDNGVMSEAVFESEQMSPDEHLLLQNKLLTIQIAEERIKILRLEMQAFLKDCAVRRGITTNFQVDIEKGTIAAAETE